MGALAARSSCQYGLVKPVGAQRDRDAAELFAVLQLPCVLKGVEERGAFSVSCCCC